MFDNEYGLNPFCVEKSLEVTGVEIVGRKMAVVTVYRSPDGDFDIQYL